MRRWPSESILAKAACAAFTVSSLRWLISSSAAAQAAASVSRTITCSRMPNFTLRPWRAARTSAILRAAASRRLAPGQVHVQLLGRQLVRASDEPPKYSGGYGFCVGGYSTLPPLDTSFSPSWL